MPIFIPSDPISLKRRLEQFLDELPQTSIVRQVSRDTGCTPAVAEKMLETYANEAQITFNLVASSLSREKRILEVGAGLCLFSLFLKSEGYDIVALEPATGGFNDFELIRQAVMAHFDILQLDIIELPSEALTPAQHGHFDLIFSNNVLEHIPNWQAALEAMLGVLADRGKMMHSCPNYLFPYEPHYGIPVLKYYPKLSRRLFADRINRSPEVWDSLNFICHNDIHRFCNKHGIEAYFQEELLYRALNRISSDPIFKKRHDKGWIGRLHQFMAFTGIIQLIRHLPPAWATPMIFSIRG